jgi:nitroimidazol reductase NimA-like FMN-containing flavoprotein (pyridoxamine 5'-phosphate oxidase superfamily)
MKTDEQGRYRMRRGDRAMPERADQFEVIRGGWYLTLALCREAEPYLVPLCYAFSEKENCFYVHCATSGKKLDFIRANQRVWGQVVDDRGYASGKGTYWYRSVMFDAMAETVSDPEAKRAALRALLERYEPDAEQLAAKMMAPAMIGRTAVLRLRVLTMTGKRNLPAETEAPGN